MNSTVTNTIKALVEHKKYDAITEYANVLHGKNNLIVSEYGGTNVRLYKDNNNKVRLLCPKHIDTVQEGYLANAIANGSVFEDAEDIDKNAGVIERLTIPYDAMVNSGREVPTNLKPMIAIVVGRMKDDGSFGVTDADRTNGVNFVKDVTAAKENGEKINGVVDNYVEKEPGGFYTPEIGKGISKLDGELDEVNDTDPADVISDDDTVDSYDDYDMDAIERDPDTEDDNEPVDNDAGDSEDDHDEPVEAPEEEPEEDEPINDNPPADEPDNELYDDDDEDFVDESYYDEAPEEVFQEGAIKTLKRLGFDPKTKTILTDIPSPDGSKKPVRCKVVFGDLESMQNGICITGHKNGGTPVIHIPIKSMLSDTDQTVSSIKHEEGHLYVSMDPERFNKEFDNAKKLVSKFSKKLSDHGNVPEEYVADLYAAQKSGDNGESLIKWLKSLGMLNRKNCTKLKQKWSEEKLHSLFAKIRKALGNKADLSDKEKEHAKKQGFNDEGSALQVIIKSFNDTIEDTAILFDTICSKNHIQPAGPGEYTENYNKNYKFKPSQGMKVSLNKIKDAIENIKLNISTIKKIIKNSIDIDKYEEACLKMTKKFHAAIDEFVHATDFEIKARIAFVRKYVNDKSVTESYAEECGNNCPTNKEVVQEDDTNDAEVVDNAEEATNASEEDMEEATEGADEAEVAEESYKFDDESDLVAESMMQSLMATFKGRGIKRDVVTESAKEEDEEKDDEKETVEECGDTKTVEECGDKEVVNEEKDVKEEDKSEVVEEEVTPMIPVTPIQEGFLSKKPKKLKPIGRDVVAYITCEMNDIHSSNDQAMLAGYTCSKIELVEWYITVIDTKDPKYIVPHDRQYLVSMKTQLENLLAQILRIRPINRSEQIWRVNYPVQA